MASFREIERYCEACQSNRVFHRQRWTFGTALLSTLTLGLAYLSFRSSRDRCASCNRRGRSLPPRPRPPVLTADELESRRYSCRICKKLNSILEVECIQCAAPRPAMPPGANLNP